MKIFFYWIFFKKKKKFFYSFNLLYLKKLYIINKRVLNKIDLINHLKILIICSKIMKPKKNENIILFIKFLFKNELFFNLC